MSAMAFGLTMLGSACMNNLFVTYYLELFCYVISLEGGWFYFGQTVFMVWNSVNDPIFGWLSDLGMGLTGESGRRGRGRLGSKPRGLPVQQSARLRAIRWGGMLWAVAFLSVWWPPQDAASPVLKGLHFAFCLCFYDSLLTYVEVNHSALLAELTTNEAERATCNMYSACCAALGSLASFFGHIYWDREDLTQFRGFCIVVAFISWLSFEATGRLISVPAAGEEGRSGDVEPLQRVVVPSPDADDGTKMGAGLAGSRDGVERPRRAPLRSSGAGTPRERFRGAVKAYLRFLREALRSSNFVVYLGFTFLQCFDCTFEKNFFPIFLDSFAAGRLTQATLATIVSSSFVLPWIGTIFVTPFVQRFGLYRVMRSIFNFRIALAAFSLLSVWYMNGTGARTLQKDEEWVSEEKDLGEDLTRAARSSFGFLWWTPFGVYEDGTPCFGLPELTCVLLLLNRIVSEAVCRLSPLVLTDIVDEDRYRNRRGDRVVTATLVGSANSFGKVSQSLAPMIGYALLPATVLSLDGKGTLEKALPFDAVGTALHSDVSAFNVEAEPVGLGEARARYGADTPRFGGDPAPLDGAERLGGGGGLEEATRQYTRVILFAVMLLIVLVQRLLWSRYTLTGAYKRKVKAYVDRVTSGRSNEDALEV
jgi:Na+/melibiose symporter-like transporter